MSARTPRQQGFALLIVMIIVATAFAVTISLSRLASTSAQVAASEENRLLAANAARTGLERATAYALDVASTTSGDFDRVLDPALEANCSNMDPTSGSPSPFDHSQISNSNFILRPRFTDTGSGHVEWPAGSNTWWRMVPMDPTRAELGAYLVRFEDDGDDDCSAAVANALTQWTSNTPTGDCLEGYNTPGAPTPPGYNSTVNPVRDMNRAIWVISLGIAPGTNPATARFRITERRMLTNAPPSEPALFVDELRTEHNATVILESGLATSQTEESHSHSANDWQVCSTNFDTTWHGSNPGFLGSCAPLGTGQFDTGSSVTIPNVPSWRSKRWLDFNSKCNFFLRNFHQDSAPSNNKDPEGLWWWNEGGSWAGGNCNDPSAFGANIPLPPDATTVDSPANPSSCWVPIMISPAGTPGMFDPCGFGDSFDQAGAVLPAVPPPGPNYIPNGATGGGGAGSGWVVWRPGPSRPATSTNCSGYYGPLPGLSAAPVLPDFLTECGVAVTQPNGSTAGACIGCDGSEWALRFQHVSGDAQWTFRAATAAGQYVPSGTYFYEGRWIPGSGSSISDATDNWTTTPNMITLVMSGDLDLGSGTDFAFGFRAPFGPPATSVGADFPWPSLIADDIQLTNGGKLTVWGGLYVEDDIQVENTSEILMYGPVVVEHDFRLQNHSTGIWRYTVPMFTPAAPPASTGIRMSFPLRF